MQLYYTHNITRQYWFGRRIIGFREMKDTGVGYLLSLHGTQVHREDGYWYKIEAWKVKPSKHVPHGIRYNLTLHDQYNKRIFGMDNSHGVKTSLRSKVSGKKHAFDHKHRHASDKGVPYEFSSCYQLLEDFFESVDRTIEKLKK